MRKTNFTRTALFAAVLVFLGRGEPAAARYLSPEPMLQDPNWVAQQASRGNSAPTYAYARNNPVAKTDPTGKWPVDIPEPACLSVAVALYMDSGAPSRQDSVKHCTASCYMARTCGPISSTVVGLGKEWPIDQVRKWMGKSAGPDPTDLKHDNIGVQCGVGMLRAPPVASTSCVWSLLPSNCLQCCLANIPPEEINH